MLRRYVPLLALTLTIATSAVGCLIDRSPLVPGDAGDLVPDAFVDEPDAPTDDAFGLDAFVAEADAFVEPDAFALPPDAALDAPTCTPRCMGAVLIECAGGVEMPRTCDLGCNEAATRCFRVDPSNVATSIFDLATSDLDVSTDRTIDTDREGLVRTQRDGTEVAVLVHGSVTVSATLRAVGSRPLVIIARDGVDVSGTIDVSAVGNTPGPRGRPGATSAGGDASGLGAGRGGTHDGDYRDGGGGGGGLCGRGGTGGSGGASSLGGVGGGPHDLGTDAETLRGGGGGGAGNGASGRFGAGGAGGGALQISSRGTITVRGRILARGSAGANGLGGSGNDGAGGGGGAGGWILLEAPDLELSGTLDASGGPGGDGEGGISGGRAGGGSDSNGGNGATHDSYFGDGGGGGGGAGCIVLRSHRPPMLATTSPRDAIGLHLLPLSLD
jgi:hypothetical protein